jgi:hypothetical protein
MEAEVPCMFVLVTPEKVKLSVRKSAQSTIKPFSSFGGRIVTYTDKGGHAAKKNPIVLQFLQSFDVVFERTYLYRSDLQAGELATAKLAMPHECHVYVTSAEFVDGVLPLLDLMVLTTSGRETVQMDVWLPSEDTDKLKQIIHALAKQNLDVKALMTLTAKIYNQNAAKVLAEAQRMEKIMRHKDDRDSHIVISRNYIAVLIRSSYITRCIKRYSATAMHEFGDDAGISVTRLQGV